MLLGTGIVSDKLLDRLSVGWLGLSRVWAKAHTLRVAGACSSASPYGCQYRFTFILYLAINQSNPRDVPLLHRL
jgi:hypothetical protein